MAVPLPQAVVERILNKAFGHLVTYNRDGSAQVTLVWLDTDGKDVLINTETRRQKARNLRRDSRAIVSLQDPADPMASIVITGTASSISEEGARDHIDKLAQRYVGTKYDWSRPGDVRVLIRITPDQVRS
jgi:PPOX class probable F420-dependent enzyme